MEKKLCIKSSSGGAVTAITYFPSKREVVAGHEDGLMRCWELDSGKPSSSNHKHKGWVSQLIYWSEGKILFSASVDYTIVQWSTNFEPFNTIELSGPVYSLLWNPRKDQLVCGQKGHIGVFNLSGQTTNNGCPILSSKEYKLEGHTDIVKCLACMGSKAYSAGFDRKLIVYEVSTLPGALPLRPQHINHHAHEAGIICMLVTKDNMDSSTWLATGSFDQKTKIWTAEGKPMLQIACPGSVTGLSYIFQNKVLWIAAGTPMPMFFDPKLGANVTPYVPVLGEGPVDKSRIVQSLKYFPEICEVIGFTNYKEIVTWKYNISCSICIQNSPTSAHIETVTYTNKTPILIFTGSYDAVMTKWERHQLNKFNYDCEPLLYKDQLMVHLCSKEGEWNMLDVVEGEGLDGADNRGLLSEATKARCRAELMEDNYRGFVSSLYVEALDYLIASSLDGKIFIWGYDEGNLELLIRMTENESTQNSADGNEATVSRRVIGYSCLHVLNCHSASVSGLALIEKEKDKNYYLVSVGWDCFICVWDLKNASLLSRSNHGRSSSSSLSNNAVITDLDYSQELDMLAYSTSDGCVNLCPFSTSEKGIKVKSSLMGHREEVTQVKWNRFLGKWVTGSEDGTIRLWAGNNCEMIVSAGGPVSILTIDKNYGYILAAVYNIIKLYDGELVVIHSSHGHQDSIQTIIHIPELDQYISTSWDKTLRIWKGYHPRHQSKNA